MTWIKICGTTNLEDALLAIDAGADALGFVFYEKSPRYISREAAQEIIAKLPAAIEKVGVFVDETLEFAEGVAERIGLSAIQSSAKFRTGPRTQTKAVGSPQVKKYALIPSSWLFDEDGFRGFSWSEEFKKTISAILLDSVTATRPGGTGQVFDWEKAATSVQALQLEFKVVVAGGLTATNVTEAIRILKPWGVDVVSGVEASPGKKDPEKVRAFIKAVRKSEKIS